MLQGCGAERRSLTTRRPGPSTGSVAKAGTGTSCPLKRAGRVGGCEDSQEMRRRSFVGVAETRPPSPGLAFSQRGGALYWGAPA
ncbi:hypothetical protein A176_000048 [Myxococcus hansupus]|uniref:Uncharacterized protein n=1 Tax=Pseudomyxococcus hansupus TaxID=1297742 RepID=A0A0H4WIK4_9BACT|nr:hypothetical protein A176_000048 [Myxococcus hansupus]